jgi:hypothetical protein
MDTSRDHLHLHLSPNMYHQPGGPVWLMQVDFFQRMAFTKNSRTFHLLITYVGLDHHPACVARGKPKRDPAKAPDG